MSSGGPTIRTYRDKKTVMKRVRNMDRQTFSNPAVRVKRNVESNAASMNDGHAGLAAKHPFANVPRLFAGPWIFDHLVERFLNFTKPEFDRKLLIFPADPQLQGIACRLLL